MSNIIIVFEKESDEINFRIRSCQTNKHTKVIRISLCITSNRINICISIVSFSYLSPTQLPVSMLPNETIAMRFILKWEFVIFARKMTKLCNFNEVFILFFPKLHIYSTFPNQLTKKWWRQDDESQNKFRTKTQHNN